MKNLLIIITFLFSAESYCQVERNTIDSIIEIHLREFRETIAKEAPVFISFDYDFKNRLSLSGTDYYLNLYINSKKLKSKENFLVKFIVTKRNNQAILEAINFRLEKTGRREISFINIGGYSYDIITGERQEED